MFEQQTILKPKWQQRFDFFDSIENMTEEEKKSVYKKAPFFVKFNWLGFIFRSYYLILLGAWKTGLFLWVLSNAIIYLIVYRLDNFNLSDDIVMVMEILFFIGVNMFFGLITNYVYYCYSQKGIDSPMKTLKNAILLWK